MNYRSMSDANIRMCIVTEYNRIFSVWCIKLLFALDGNFIS